MLNSSVNGENSKQTARIRKRVRAGCASLLFSNPAPIRTHTTVLDRFDLGWRLMNNCNYGPSAELIYKWSHSLSPARRTRTAQRPRAISLSRHGFVPFVSATANNGPETHPYGFPSTPRSARYLATRLGAFREEAG